MSQEFVNRRNIQWFPGHMTRTLRVMEADIKNVDVVVQLLDARIPQSSLNPEIQRITARKPRLYVMNKADLADPAVTARWKRWFENQRAGCVAISSKNRGAAGAVRAQIEQELAQLIARREQKGTAGASIRVMVVGIPNVGKSTFINCWAGSARAKAADRPGVTRGKQWISVPGYELLDMPGVLWKKFESLETATNLAFIGSIKDDILDIEELAMGLLSQVREIYPQRLLERYKLKPEDLELDPWELLEAIGRRRGMLVSGGEVNTERAAIMVVDEFRASKWGRISLEQPPREGEKPDDQ
ncbi:MAG TPA: ribosome biogenesis GTPase YlqF [Candidatus Anaerofilum excrementigallinarum]|nr:ribosome biogenesis GTPase YlqF [Candidatus Anaerofilum excrementigallinarum]